MIPGPPTKASSALFKLIPGPLAKASVVRTGCWLVGVDTVMVYLSVSSNVFCFTISVACVHS